MANTFNENLDSEKIIEPIFSRSRQKYKGNRNSIQENLEINAFIIDVNRIESQATSLDSSLENISLNLVSRITDLSDEDILQDGKDFEIENTNILFDDKLSEYGTLEQNMILESLNKISGKITKLQNKIKRLENES
jgi:conjugal transfer/entry exclusion protein